MIVVSRYTVSIAVATLPVVAVQGNASHKQLQRRN
jgi:hypothetical protein